MELSDFSLPVTGPGNPAWLDQVLQGPGQVATAQFSEDPFIKLRKKLAADQKAALDRRRAADDAVLPQIIEDYKQSSARADAIMQRIDVAMGSLNAPPPQMGQPQMNQGEMLAGGLTALIAPDVLPQVLTGLGQAASQRNEVEFENTLRAYGLTRETTKMALSQLMGRLDREYGVMDGARKSQFALQESRRKELVDLQDSFDEASRTIDQLEMKHGLDMSMLREKLKAEIEAKKLELEAETGKRLSDDLKSIADDFRAAIATNFAGANITQQDANELNEEADGLTAEKFPGYGQEGYRNPEADAFRSRLGTWKARTLPVVTSQDFNERKWNEGAGDRKLEGDINREKLRQMKEQPSPATANRQKQFAEVDKRINAARAKVEELESLGPPSGEVEKYERELRAERIKLAKAEADKARLLGKPPKEQKSFMERVKDALGRGRNVRTDTSAKSEDSVIINEFMAAQKAIKAGKDKDAVIALYEQRLKNMGVKNWRYPRAR